MDDGEVSAADVRDQFGDDVAVIVEEVSKLSQISQVMNLIG